VRAEVDINEADIAKVGIGSPVVVALDSYPAKQFDAALVKVYPAADRQRGTVKIEVQIARPDLQIIKPEMSAKVSFLENQPTSTQQPRITVPKGAVRSEEGETYVWTVRESIVKRVSIVRGQETETGIEIKQGLKDGDVVVVSPQANLANGRKVSVGTEWSDKRKWMHWHRLKLPDTVTDTDVFKGVTTMGRLADKNILITGGNSGIGLAAAQEFDREGARVAICGLNERSLQAANGWFHKKSFEGCSFINVWLESKADSPVRRAATIHLAKIRAIVRGLAEEAKLQEPEKFAQAWHMLMKGSIVSAGEGNRNAARDAKCAAQLILDGWQREGKACKPNAERRFRR
jgi:hypothetical protein